MSKVKKWIISAVTLTILALVGSGIYVGTFDPDRGYPLIVAPGDTLWFDDSLELVTYADSLLWSGVDTSHVYVCVNFEGRIIDYVDPQAWRQHADTIFSGLCKAFKYTQWPREQLPQLREIIADTTDKWRIDFNDLAVAINDPTFADSFHTRNTTVILPRGPPYIDMVKDKKDVDNPIIIDRFVHTIGDSTVGSGGAFATMVAAWADLGNLTGDVTHRYISNVGETGNAQGTENLGGFTLTVISDSPSFGDPTAGYQVSLAGTNHHWLQPEFEGPGTLDIGNFRINRTGTYAAAYGVVYALNSSTGYTLKVHNILCDGSGQNGTLMSNQESNNILEMWNCIIWNQVSGMYVSSQVMHVSSEVENNTVFQCAVGVVNGNHANTFNGTVFFGNTNNFSGAVNSISNYCATEKATVGAGTDNNAQTSLTIANEVENQSDGSPDFMRVKCGATIADLGGATAIGANTQGIRGADYPRPHETTLYSIGADELYIDRDTAFRDTTIVDSNCVGAPAGSLFVARIDSEAVDTICGLDTTFNWTVSVRTIDTLTVVDATGFCGLAIQPRGFLNVNRGYLNRYNPPWLDRRR